MNFIRQRNRWECAAASTATMCGSTIQEVIDFCGHDGSEIVEPNLPFPMCHKGFAMEEMIDFARTKNIFLCQYTAFPMLTADGKSTRELWSEDYCVERMRSLVDNHSGLLIGRVRSPSQNWHVVYWNHEENRCYDPSLPKPADAITIDPALFLVAIQLYPDFKGYSYKLNSIVK